MNHSQGDDFNYDSFNFDDDEEQAFFEQLQDDKEGLLAQDELELASTFNAIAGSSWEHAVSVGMDENAYGICAMDGCSQECNPNAQQCHDCAAGYAPN